MGTSNWQHISYCIEVIRDISPKSILDIGVGFGRWGILSREFLEVWDGKVDPKSWDILIDGVEIFPDTIKDYHHAFYNNVFITDAAVYVKEMNKNYDLIILGDVLEHFEKNAAEKLLRECLDKSEYVLLNIPIGNYWKQEAGYGNIHEQHLSFWKSSEFRKFGLIKKKKFKDFILRNHYVFILSKKHSSIRKKYSFIEKVKVLLDQYPKTKSLLKSAFRG